MFDFLKSNCSVNDMATENSSIKPEYLDKFRYDGDDLGVVYTSQNTTFKLWAPTAEKVKLNLYATGSDSEENAEKLGSADMNYNPKNGIWSITVIGDLKDIYYTYSVKNLSSESEVVDIYAKAVGVNGNRGMVVDLGTTNPDGWENDKRVLPENQTQAIVWEVQIKDFSNQVESGISEKHRGKYLAFTESGTTLKGSELPTGIDYLKKLGITHVQLNPFYDFGSVDERNQSGDEYNWGYDPKNYNVPEGSYSTNPYDGNIRIKEVKQMIQSLHNAGIGVIMDVVYNHTYTGYDSFFNLTVPNYYYRSDDEGNRLDYSGCGNDTASERAMYSKFMVDSVSYWATEYHIDGFRFDLMGLHDVETMGKIREKLNTIDKRIIMYGEAWNLGTVDNIELAVQKNIPDIEGVAAFNDGMRDAIKGDNFEAVGKGFVQGEFDSDSIKSGFIAATDDWADSPVDTVTYISCHDNMTFYDKLVASILGTKDITLYRKRNEQLVEMNKLGATLSLTSQGMAFMLAGEEMARSKDGDHNSYVSSPSLNQIDWENIEKFGDLVAYYNGLINLRKSYEPFMDSTNKTIENMTMFENTKTKVIGFMIENVLNNNQWNKVVCLFNSDIENDIEVQLEGENIPEDWVVVVDKESAGIKKLSEIKGTKVIVPKTSALVLVDKESFDKANIKVDTEFSDLVIKNFLAKTKSKNSREIVPMYYKEGKSKKSSKVIVGKVVRIATAIVVGTAVGVFLAKRKKKKK